MNLLKLIFLYIKYCVTDKAPKNVSILKNMFFTVVKPKLYYLEA